MKRGSCEVENNSAPDVLELVGEQTKEINRIQKHADPSII